MRTATLLLALAACRGAAAPVADAPLAVTCAIADGPRGSYGPLRGRVPVRSRRRLPLVRPRVAQYGDGSTCQQHRGTCCTAHCAMCI